jgi:hypothetical protein
MMPSIYAMGGKRLVPYAHTWAIYKMVAKTMLLVVK